MSRMRPYGDNEFDNYVLGLFSNKTAPRMGLGRFTTDIFYKDHIYKGVFMLVYVYAQPRPDTFYLCCVTNTQTVSTLMVKITHVCVHHAWHVECTHNLFDVSDIQTFIDGIVESCYFRFVGKNIVDLSGLIESELTANNILYSQEIICELVAYCLEKSSAK